MVRIIAATVFLMTRIAAFAFVHVMTGLVHDRGDDSGKRHVHEPV